VVLLRVQVRGEVVQDPMVAWAERLRGRFEREKASLQLSGHRPGWFESWIVGKEIQGLTVGTLLRYVEDLKCYGHDPETLSLEEIQRTLVSLRQRIRPASYRRTLITVKQVLKFVGRNEDADKLRLPKPADARIDTLQPAEIQKMLQGCQVPMHRLLIEFLVELKARRGEICALKIEDIQFDRYSPIVWLRGKTGERRRRIYVSKADLMAYLESHPYKDNPNAPLWITWQGKALRYEGIYKIVRKIAKRTLPRDAWPHILRHTGATREARHYTDSVMMKLYRWKTPAMVRVYSHLSMKDVDDVDLIAHGLKPASDAEEPLIEVRRCWKCQAENGPVALYCQSCGEPITQTDEIKDLNNKVSKLQGDLAEYQKLVDKIMQGQLVVRPNRES
jgi:integrase/recombinase XerD